MSRLRVGSGGVHDSRCGIHETKTAPPATGGAVPSDSSDDASENVPNLRSADGAERRLTRLRGGTPPLAYDTVRFGIDRLGLLLTAPPSFGRPPLCFLLGTRLQPLAYLERRNCV